MIGTKFAHFTITAHLGSGGMGEVYQATDSKLGRSVAIKLLPAAFASDPERLSRFRREAQLLASLNHPNIAHIYGLEESGETRCIVMELVEGETLQERIKKGPIPVDEALTVAKQIAEALEAAHEKGVIHRDLKPGNVMLTSDGRVKVLDFGLAKAYDANPSSATSSNSPTMASMAATNAGVILGTAAYMSPEQARGKTVDRRADIWAFGAVLFEMLTGQRAFPGEDLTDTLANVLKMEPDWERLAGDVPPRVRQVLRACLRKDAKQRIGDVQDMRLAFDGAFETTAPQTMAPTTSSSARGRLAWMAAFAVAVLVAAALAIPAMRHLRETPAPSLPEMRTDIVTPPTLDPISFALSPDGRKIVFVAAGDGQARLWLRPLDSVTAQPLAGTDGASYPFWSPDSRSVGFFADAKLKRLDIGGGLPQALADAMLPRGGTWSSESVILFAGRPGGLSRVPASGGETTAATEREPGQNNHRFPQFLPGGRQFLFFAPGSQDVQGIYLGSLDNSKIKRVTAADVAGLYMPGWLLDLRQGTLVAQRFDTERGVLTGSPVTVSEGVGFDDGLGVGAFSVSAAGLVAYRQGSASRRQPTWVDRSGKLLGTLGAPDDGLFDIALSPDGRRVAVYRVVQGNQDIWVIDEARTTRFTFDPSPDTSPIWSPDGSKIVFRSGRKGKGFSDLYQKPSSGAAPEELLVESQQTKSPTDWSSDGRFILYQSFDPKTNWDLWVLPLDGDRKPRAFLNTNFDERYGQFSPDGRWVAYQSNESGQNQIYIRPFAGPGGQWQVSTVGGISPRWRADGKELFYIAPDGRMMAAPIAIQGPTVEPGAPIALFQTRIAGGGALVVGTLPQYDVALDGRFLINAIVDDAVSPITMLQNWHPEPGK